MATDNSEILTQSFPLSPYNFDTAPPGYSIGPIKTLLTACGEYINDFINHVNELQAQITVQTATGAYLRAHAVLYGVTPIAGESDDAFRARILARRQKLTLQAIEAVAQNYFDSLGGVVPTVTVLDLQSDNAAATAAGLQNNDFLIDINYDVPMDDVFFCDYSYCDYTTYLWSNSAQVITPSSDLLERVNETKAAGEHPVFENTYTFT